jgi:arsenite methyltransferase
VTDYLDHAYDVNQPDFVSVYDELPLWSAMFGLVLLERVELKPDMNVLDVGCGTGFPLLELAQRLGPSCHAFGIDPWKAALRRARQKIEAWSIRNVDVVEADAAAMPFADGRFDLIVSNLGINNFDRPEAVLAECWRVARPRARLALTTNLQGHMQQFYDVFQGTLEELGKATRLDRLRAHIEHRGTAKRLSDMLESAGFKVRQLHQQTFIMRFLNGSAMLRHAFIRIGFLDAWRGILTADEEKQVFLRLEENLNRFAEKRGGLALTIPMAYTEAEKIV